MLQLVSTQPHDGPLDGRDFGQRAVELRHDQRIELGRLLGAAAQEGVVVDRIGFMKTRQPLGEGVDLGDGLLAHQHLIQALQGKLARAAAGVAHRFTAFSTGDGFGHACDSSSRAISTATRAASRPLSCCRATAWAVFSVVRMALAMGT